MAGQSYSKIVIAHETMLAEWSIHSKLSLLAVAASLGSTGPLQFRSVRMDRSGEATIVCGEVKDRQADYRPFAYFSSTNRALILPAGGSSAATMTVAPDFPDTCIPDTGRHAVEASAEPT